MSLKDTLDGFYTKEVVLIETAFLYFLVSVAVWTSLLMSPETGHSVFWSRVVCTRIIACGVQTNLILTALELCIQLVPLDKTQVYVSEVFCEC